MAFKKEKTGVFIEGKLDKGDLEEFLKYSKGKKNDINTIKGKGFSIYFELQKFRRFENIFLYHRGLQCIKRIERIKKTFH